MSDKSVPIELQPWLDAWALPDPALLDDWLSTMKVIQLDSDEVLINAGDPSRHVYLISEGLVRLFYVTEDGKERNKAFYGEGQITGAVSAAMTGAPAPFSIQTLEPTRLIRAEFQALSSQASNHLALSQLLLGLLSDAFIRNEQREAILLTGNAEQRYRWVTEHEPHWLERVPQYHIASYLGVDAVSLSRLKRKLENE